MICCYQIRLYILHRLLSGVSGDEEQWRYCTSDTDSVIGFAVGAMFVREAFHGESKTSVSSHALQLFCTAAICVVK